MTFSGFPAAGLSFFRDLAKDNDRDWFEKNRAVWDEQIVPAMICWCEELAGRLREVMPGVKFVPRFGGSLYRLNRDIRFSKDKRPYQTHTAALLWEGSEKHGAPGFYLQVSPDEVILGGGLYVFEEAHLDRYRKRLLNEKAALALEQALAAAQKAGMKPEGEKLKRPPRGFVPEHPRAELSKYKGLVVAMSHKPATWLHTREALDRSEAAARAYAPLHAWLRDELCG